MEAIVDTNVPLVANRTAPQASPACVIAAVKFLHALQQSGLLVLDDSWLIVNEYKHKLDQRGQPGVGDAFLKWVLTNQANPQRCRRVAITIIEDGFDTFPNDPALANFDPSDRKFVAVAIADSAHPPIYNAVDSDWWQAGIAAALSLYAVRVEHLCPDALRFQR